MKKYKKVKMPLEAYVNFKKKQLKLEDTLRKLIGRGKIPMTGIYNVVSEKTLYLDDEEVVKLAKRRKRK